MTMNHSIRVALAGVGNCASALIQGLSYYKDDDPKSGIWHRLVGGHQVKDIEIVAAFDIDSKKIGTDISKSIFSETNVVNHYTDMNDLNVEVQSGILEDEFPEHMKKIIEVKTGEKDDLIKYLTDNRTDILVNLIPSGLDETTKAYADIAIKSKCCFINAAPTRIASDNGIVERFEKEKLVVVGDDLMSQFGGTAFHKGILDFMHSRGIKIARSYQLDVGGGNETLNTLKEDIKFMKRNMKTKAISMEVPYDFETVTGTTDYVEYMKNQRTSYYWIQGESFLGSPIAIDIYLRTSDGPNAGNVLLDVIRAVKIAKDCKDYGAPLEICGYGFKNLHRSIKLKDAYESFMSKYVDIYHK